ncbi:hypothetical protein DL768_002153 [Monosporascus sp. mg162]|nr:hypothetical protein DL768_002153 [Monosporascus sp. mg162]
MVRIRILAYLPCRTYISDKETSIMQNTSVVKQYGGTREFNALDLAQPTSLRAFLRSGELLWGTSCRIASEEAARSVATLPHHFRFIDLSPLNATTLVNLIKSIQQFFYGRMVLYVRIAPNSPDLINYALNARAGGIVMPHIQNAAYAERFVHLAKFPPSIWTLGNPYHPFLFSTMAAARDIQERPAAPELLSVPITEHPTVIGLLSYRSGFRPIQFLVARGRGRFVLEKSQLLSTYNDLEATGDLRTDWAYSNWDYAVAGEVIEALIGTSPAQRCVSIFDVFPPVTGDTIMGPVVGGWNTPEDLMKYATALLQAYRHATMLLPGHIFPARSPVEKSYAFGLHRSQLPGTISAIGWNSMYVKKMPRLVLKGRAGPVMAYGGSLPWCHVAMALLPELGSSVVVCTNSIAVGDVSGWQRSPATSHKPLTQYHGRYRYLGKYDYETIHTFVDKTPILYVSFSPATRGGGDRSEGEDDDAYPVVLSMLGFAGDFRNPESSLAAPRSVSLRGYVSSRTMRTAATGTGPAAGPAGSGEADSGLRICVAATLLDGLVLALIPNHHSCDHCSAVVFGHAYVATDEAEPGGGPWIAPPTTFVPGRWAASHYPNATELWSTGILRVDVDSASAKIRTGSTGEARSDLNEERLQQRVWTGVVPAHLVWGDSVAAPTIMTDGVPRCIEERMTKETEAKKYAYQVMK